MLIYTSRFRNIIELNLDSLTHIALGALIGEVIAGKELGKKAMLLGAVAQSIPDIDFLASLWLPPDENLLAHRGLTHSAFFAILLAPLLAIVASYFSASLSVKKWMFFFGLQIFIHLIIDTCNVYGVGWLEPFRHNRFSFNTLFVADPFFSVSLGITALILLVLKTNNTTRIKWAGVGLIISTIYLMYAITNKVKVEDQIKQSLDLRHIQYKRYLSTPTPFNTWLWYIVAESEAGYYISYRSVFDSDHNIKFNYFSRNDSLFASLSKTQELKNLLIFSQGYYTINQHSDTLIFNDLRFGQITGWANPKRNFVFHYYLNRPLENTLVMQRGRFTAWDYRSIKLFLKRIRGR